MRFCTLFSSLKIPSRATICEQPFPLPRIVEWVTSQMLLQRTKQTICCMLIPLQVPPATDRWNAFLQRKFQGRSARCLPVKLTVPLRRTRNRFIIYPPFYVLSLSLCQGTGIVSSPQSLGYELEYPGFKSRHRPVIFPPKSLYRSQNPSNLPLIGCRGFLLWVRRPESETDHSATCSAEIKNGCNYSSSTRLNGVHHVFL
jgi:hypothetical protein